jgi:uncharacterized protein (TIGR01777 family)
VRVLVSGATGFVGSALVPLLEERGDEVVRLVRANHVTGERDVPWDATSGKVDASALRGTEAAVHLAGETLAGRWTEQKKRRIVESRELGTRGLSAALAALDPMPRVLVSASAVGIYGDRGSDEVTEDSQPGFGFLPDVVRRWEEAAAPALDAGIRIVHLRFGIIMSVRGGMLQRLLMPFKLGVGGPVGSGNQYLSWISLDDALRAILYALDSSSLAGPVNAAAPSPVTSREFAKTLGRVLGRPAFLPAPASALKLVFGREFAEEALLSGVKATPTRLLSHGFEFRHPQLEDALRDTLDRRFQ